MWPFAIAAAVIASLVLLSRKTGDDDVTYEGSIGTSTEEGRKAKAALPAGARFYYPAGAGPMAIDKDGNDLFWDGESWRKP